MVETERRIPRWLLLADLFCAILAGALWFVAPQIGPWPLVLALAPWAARFLVMGRISQPTPFDLPLVLFLAAAALGVWAAYDREAAWSKFWLIVGGVCLFYAFVNAHPLAATVRVGFIALFAVGLALCFLTTNDWGAYEVEIAGLTRLGRELQTFLPSVSGPQLDLNEVGGMLAMLLPFGGWWAVKSLRDVRDSAGQSSALRWLVLALAWLALAITLFGLLMTVSWGAWVASGTALLLVALWMTIGRLGRGNETRRACIFLCALALVIVAASGLAVAWFSGPATSSHSLLGIDSLRSQLQVRRNSLLLVRDYPLIGAGLEQFKMLYSSYVLLLHVGFVPHTDTLFLDVAIELGLTGLLALIWMWSLLAMLVWQTILRPSTSLGNTASHVLVGITALSLVIVLMHGMVHNGLYGRGALLLFVPLAFATPIVSQQREQARQRRALGLLLLGLPLSLALLWPGRTLAIVHSNLGAIQQGQAELSIYEWPVWPIQDAVRLKVDMTKPITQFEQALALDPENPTANRRLGMIELSLGEYEQALKHLEAAYKVESESATTRQLLGEALIVNGRVDEGQALWSTLNNERMQLEARAFWYGYIGDTERAAWVREAMGTH
jgi:hypothetical protein